MADKYPLTAAYKRLVEEGILQIEGNLPDYVKNVSSDLKGEARLRTIKDVLAKECQRIHEADSSKVFDVEGFKGNRQKAKDFLRDVLALAEAGGIKGAGDALKKVSSINITDNGEKESEKESENESEKESKTESEKESENESENKSEKKSEKKSDTESEKESGNNGENSEKKEKKKKKKDKEKEQGGKKHKDKAKVSGNDSSNDSGNESGSEYGSEYSPGSRGRGRSATPMNDEVREQLQPQLKEYYDRAIEPLRNYISAGLLKCKPADTTNFAIPFGELKKMLSKAVVTALEDAQSDEYAQKLGKAKIRLYYLCRNRNIPQKLLSGLLIDPANEGVTYEYRSIYNKENRSATEYWPYRTLQGNGFLVLFEKKKHGQKKDQSSFGVQVFDAQSKKFRVEMRKSIGSDILNEWRELRGTYTFWAADRKHSKDKDGEIEEVFFYTMTQKQTSVAHSSQSAHAEVCVKFTNSIWPRMIQKCDVQKLLPANEEVDKILEGLARRDHILLPREFTPNNVIIPMRPRGDGRQEVLLQKALNWRNTTPIDPSVSNYSRDSVPPDFETPRQTRESTFSPNYDDGLSQLRNEFDKKFSNLNSRMDRLEESVVTTEYLDNRFNQFFRQISEKLERVQSQFA